MLFNSIEFLIFFPTVFFFYWFVFGKNLQLQNLFILISSYFFYGWWDYRFLLLIIISSVTDYYSGIAIAKTQKRSYRFCFLIISIFINLGILFFFKYYNFFIESFSSAFLFLGHNINFQSLNIVLPVGISFYTFQSMSYTIDIYNNKIKPTRSLIVFFSFVSFFPQLVAGPIERAKKMIPQFELKRDLIFSWTPFFLICSGLMRKMVFADNFALYVDSYWNSLTYGANFYGNLIAVLFFSFQIYFDFSGYSRIARGLALLLGFKLVVNFDHPYDSISFSEFWKRWHISLSSWFRDYLYFPLGGNRVSSYRVYINLMIVFLISGLWHGSNLTFVLWGFIHGSFLILEKKFKIKWNKSLIFLIICFSWIPFRANNLNEMVIFYDGFTNFNLSLVSLTSGIGFVYFVFLMSLFMFMFLYINLEKKKSDLIFLLFPVLIFLFSRIGDPFVYFQF